MILICDDEKNIRRTLSMVLEGEGYPTRVAATASEALVQLSESAFDAVLLDVRLPDLNGIETLRRIKESDLGVEVIMISGHATLQDAVEATRLGAFDFLEKPIDRERLLITVRNALERLALRIRVQDLAEKDNPLALIGDSAPMRQLLSEIDKVAKTKARVLITGESGSGKELVARAIHALSPRADRPFVKVNCAAIPRSSSKASCFGHEKGSFTGPSVPRRPVRAGPHRNAAPRRGRRHEPHRSGEGAARDPDLRDEPGGRRGAHQVDVRIIAATNKESPEGDRRRPFREDLYFPPQCRAVEGAAPERAPGRHRPHGPRPLEHFAKEHGLPRKQMTPETLDRLKAHRWPGNVRELKNVIERLPHPRSRIPSRSATSPATSASPPRRRRSHGHFPRKH